MKQTLIIILVQTVLIAGVAGGSWYFASQQCPNGEPSAEGAPVAIASSALREKHFLSLAPPFVVNLEDGRELRFLQVEIDLMAYDAAVFERVEKFNSRIRNDINMFLPTINREMLRQENGRQQLQDDALAVVNKALTEESGQGGVVALYFTKFVIQ